MTAQPEGFRYVPDFLNREEVQKLTKQLEQLTYEHDTFRGQRLKRGYAQFGYAYVTTGRKLEPADPFPDFLAALAARCLAHCPAGTKFDQGIVTLYPTTAGIDWHTDAPCFGETVAAVSLGADALLMLRQYGTEEPCHELVVTPGSLYVMTGLARWKYQHKVAPVMQERYSITFRSVNLTSS